MVNENSIRSQADIDADLKVIYGDARYVPITIDFQNHVIIVYFISCLFTNFQIGHATKNVSFATSTGKRRTKCGFACR